MRVITVIGARPQFVKAAVVSRAIGSALGITEKIIHTGQHYDVNMSEVFFAQMSIPKPDYHLDCGNMSHGAMTGKMLADIETILSTERPDVVVVYGDTNSTLAGALAAAKLNIPVAHVEAGLRSFNMRMPEEINRILTDRISTWLFAPTDTAVKNLVNEGYTSSDNNFGAIENVGDVMLEAVNYYRRNSVPSVKTASIAEGRPFVLATIHRAENTDDIVALSDIFKALSEISDYGLKVVVPLHPRTRKIIETNRIDTNKIDVHEPLSYFDMIALLSKCQIVMTDSGGLQKEAYFFGKPCLTLRAQTEWVELVSGGYNVIAGNKKEDILKCFNQMINKKMNFETNLYGNGKASEKIVNSILRRGGSD